MASDLIVDLDDIHDRSDAETVLDALYQRLQALIRHLPGDSNALTDMQMLVTRLRATLDRTPERYARLQKEGRIPTSFVYEGDELAHLIPEPKMDSLKCGAEAGIKTEIQQDADTHLVAQKIVQSTLRAMRKKAAKKAAKSKLL